MFTRRRIIASCFMPVAVDIAPPGGRLRDLTASAPLSSSYEGQLIRGLHIKSSNIPGLLINHARCRIEDCLVEHSQGPGIVCTAGASESVFKRLVVLNAGAPQSGREASPGCVNFEAHGPSNISILDTRLLRGSSGIYMLSCRSAKIDNVHGFDFRGPFPRGQFVQLDKCVGVSLSHFSVNNIDRVSYPEDVVSVYKSLNCTLTEGTIWGNDSPSGSGVMFEGSAGGVCSDVDVAFGLNGSFTAAGGSVGVTFIRCRSFANRAADLGRGPPSSKGLIFGSFGVGTRDTRFIRCLFFRPGRGDNIVFSVGQTLESDIHQGRFEPKTPTILAIEPDSSEL